MDIRQVIGPALLGLAIALVVILVFNARRKIITYARETRVELGKVSWPTRQEATNLTVVVVVTVTISALFLGFFDALFTWIFAQLIQR